MIKYPVRTDAGKIWQFLDKKGEASLHETKEQLNLQEHEI